MKKIFKYFFILICLITFIQIQTKPALAQNTQEWSGVCIASDDPNDDAYNVATIQGIQCLLANILISGLSLIGIASFAMAIYGAINYMLSGANASKKEKAAKTIYYPVIALILALSSFIIVTLLSRFIGIQSILFIKLPTSGPAPDPFFSSP